MEKSIGNTDFISVIKEQLDIGDIDANMYSPLVLAYIGDCVYELIVRTYLVSRANMQVNKLHKEASEIVKAHSQSDMIAALEDKLTDEEVAIYRRGRNAKSFTSAKNATIGDYRRATGFEALIGYLYLTEQYERIMELVKTGLERLGKLHTGGNDEI